MVVISEDGRDFHFDGHQGGTIKDSINIGYDASTLTSTQAELLAILYAALYLRQLGIGTRKYIHTDSMPSIQIICCRGYHQDPITTSMVTYYWQILRGCDIQLCHTKAYVGMPWNECADTCAKW